MNETLKSFLVVVVIIIVFWLLLNFINNKPMSINDQCEFMAGWESTKGNYSAIKQKFIYDGYYRACRNGTYDFEEWKTYNNIK